MNKHKFTIIAAALLFAVIPLSLAAASPSDMIGRDVAGKGVEKTLTGILKSEDGEWYLEADGTTYEVHLGRVGYDLDGKLKAGDTATINGFVYENHIAPITVESNGNTINVWSKDRRPSWAGKGDRRNAGRHNDCGECDETEGRPGYRLR